MTKFVWALQTLYLVITSINAQQFLNNNWTLASASVYLPRSTSSTAICALDHTIYLFGGNEQNTQWVEYDTLNEIMSDKTSLPSGITASSGGDAQYWSWNELYGVLYWLKHVGSKEHIISYDPLSNVFVDNTTIINHIAGSTLSNDYACVASFEHYIFVIGGFSPTMDCGGCGQPFLFIYDRSSNVWSTGSNMKHGRRSHQCAVDLNNQVLFAIGGWNKEDGFVSSVETIAINNINNEQWSDSEPLLDAVVGAPSIFYDHFIFVIAGHSVSVGINNQMQIIDCDNNGQVSRGPYLHYAVINHAPVIVNDVLYVFGGKDTGSSPVNTWQYLELTGTNAPTLRTSAPTNIPTANPSTRNPTHNPTVAPTTSNPSNSPSNLPTITPTLFPTTPSPTTPEPLSCPAETVGDYNNEAISFKVNVEKEGSLTFDASDSDFVVTQIDAIYGINTPQGHGSDDSGILVIENAISGPYTFTISADEGIYGEFNISVWCEFISTSSPTRIPTLIPTLNPLQYTSTIFGMTASTEQQQANTMRIVVYEQWWFYGIALLIIGIIVFAVIYVHRQGLQKHEEQVQIGLELQGERSLDTVPIPGAEGNKNVDFAEPGSMENAIPGKANEGVNEYEWLENVLMVIDEDWKEYLMRFKKHKITDKLLRSGAIGPEHKMWDQVMPEWGVRVQLFPLIYQYGGANQTTQGNMETTGGNMTTTGGNMDTDQGYMNSTDCGV